VAAKKSHFEAISQPANGLCSCFSLSMAFVLVGVDYTFSSWNDDFQQSRNDALDEIINLKYKC
jgi:hypothetical protein